MTDSLEHPMQPIYIDENQTVRFHGNAIVRYLLDAGPFDMNSLAAIPFSKDDRAQFAQLIGYSVSGFGELHYVSEELIIVADHEADILLREASDDGFEHLEPITEPAPIAKFAPPPLDITITRLQIEWKNATEYMVHPERGPELFCEEPSRVRDYWSARASTLGYVLDMLGGLK